MRHKSFFGSTAMLLAAPGRPQGGKRVKKEIFTSFLPSTAAFGRATSHLLHGACGSPGRAAPAATSAERCDPRFASRGGEPAHVAASVGQS